MRIMLKLTEYICHTYIVPMFFLKCIDFGFMTNVLSINCIF